MNYHCITTPRCTLRCMVMAAEVSKCAVHTLTRNDSIHFYSASESYKKFLHDGIFHIMRAFLHVLCRSPKHRNSAMNLRLPSGIETSRRATKISEKSIKIEIQRELAPYPTALCLHHYKILIFYQKQKYI